MNDVLGGVELQLLAVTDYHLIRLCMSFFISITWSVSHSSNEEHCSRWAVALLYRVRGKHRDNAYFRFITLKR
jgi:hypothetical protein